MSPSFANINFTPTSASIPPRGVKLRTKAVPNVPVNYQPLTPLTFLLHAALIYPDKVALVHPDVPHPVVYTNAVWAQRIQNLAYALIKAAISPGDRVAVIAPNSPLIADAHFGVLAARAILVPINTRLKPHEVEYILEHSGARLILVDHEYRHLVPATSKARVVVSNDTGRSGDPYEEFLTEGRVFSGEKAWQGLDTEADENASAILCYTSGTTGRPKGVITTLRGSYLAAVANAFEGRITKDSTYLWILPMFHAAGWTYPWANVFAIATQITLRTVNYTHIWNHLLHSGVTHYCGAPTVQIGIVNDPLAKKLPSSRPVTAIVAGAAPTAHIIAELEKKGINPVHVYGLTETYGPFTRNYDQAFWANLSLEDRSRLMARQGHAFATAEEVRVIIQAESDTLEDVPTDGKTLGEIVTRGNITMKEYFNDREATKKAFRGGYFRTGDLAVMHPDGSIAIMDRSKDIIISGGENASSLAIEQELAAHPHVLEVSVIARNHVKWGERPMAFVILHPQHVEKWKGKQREFEEDLKAHAKSRLPGFACPEWVEVVPELPKTSTGKILKTELRKVVAKL